MNSVFLKIVAVGALGALVLLPTGCVLAPRGWQSEEKKLEHAGEPYKRNFESRDLPELPPQPDWRDVLRRALIANGDLEAAYFEWAMAVSRIQQAGGYPNTPLSIGLNYMISGGDMSSFDRTTVSIGPDPMENLAFPSKVYQAAKVALEDAGASGQRFVAKKFEVQRRVLNDWYDYALLAEKIRIQNQNLMLLKLISDTAINRVQAGAAQQELLRADIEYRLGENELKNMEAELPQVRARLNAMLDRPADAPLPAPAQIPPARPLLADDATLLALAAENNPELAALAQQVAGRRDALELAKLQYIPDFNPFGGFTGSVTQFIGLGISIPTFLPEVQGMVKEARAELHQMMAMYRQTKFDRAAQLVAALYALRNSQRQAELFEVHILRAAEGIVENTRQSYAAGFGSFIDLIDSQRTLLDVRLMAAEAKAAREKSLADLEALIGLNIETLPHPTTAATTSTAQRTENDNETESEN